jgi:hypothetical protein
VEFTKTVASGTVLGEEATSPGCPSDCFLTSLHFDFSRVYDLFIFHLKDMNDREIETKDSSDDLRHFTLKYLCWSVCIIFHSHCLVFVRGHSISHGEYDCQCQVLDHEVSSE